METQENKKLTSDVIFGEPIKIFNFEVCPNFNNDCDCDKDKTAEVICVITDGVDIYTEGNKKCINLIIKSREGTIKYEKQIPHINKLNVCRYDLSGKLLITEVYVNCKFINIVNTYTYSNYNAYGNAFLKPIYKFEYDFMIFDDKYCPPFKLREDK